MESGSEYFPSSGDEGDSIESSDSREFFSLEELLEAAGKLGECSLRLANEETTAASKDFELPSSSEPTDLVNNNIAALTTVDTPAILGLKESSTDLFLETTAPTLYSVSNCDGDVDDQLPPELQVTEVIDVVVYQHGSTEELIDLSNDVPSNSNISFQELPSGDIIEEGTQRLEDTHFSSNGSPPPRVDATNNSPLQEILPPNHEVTANLEENESVSVVEPNKTRSKENQRLSNKMKRMHGQAYIGFRREYFACNNEPAKTAEQEDRKMKPKPFKMVQDVQKQARKMGPPCESKACEKYKNTRKCFSIKEEDRVQLFQTFWEWSWETKVMYVRTVVNSAKPKRVRKNNTRGVSYFYYLTINGEKFPVCKKMFLSTLGCNDQEVRCWLSSKKEQTLTNADEDRQAPEQDEEGNTGMSVDLENSQHMNGHRQGRSRIAVKFQSDYLHEWLQKLPKLPSHYARRDSKKLYLQTDFRSLAQVYSVYKKSCQEDEVGYLSRTAFVKKLKHENIDIFTPRKDQCDLCTAYEENNLPEEKYLAHIKRKDDAQKEKAKDKERAKAGEVHTVVCDLMKVECLPRISASSAYYKLKLTVHNFTVYNYGNKDVMAYWFDETNANLNANTFASFLVDYITEMLQQAVKPVVIISDGCAYQHRNAVLANALLHLSSKFGITITHKYLEVGHTYSEGDSVHARIEETYENLSVHLPSQFVELSKTARQNPFPYRAKQINHDFVKDFNHSMIYSSIRPGKTVGDPTVTDLRVIQYNPEGKILYKLDYSDDFAELPQRPKRQVDPTTVFPSAFKSPLPIPLDKYRDLASLKPMLPKDTHGFYDNLPHTAHSQREASRKKVQDEPKETSTTSIKKISNKRDEKPSTSKRKKSEESEEKSAKSKKKKSNGLEENSTVTKKKKST